MPRKRRGLDYNQNKNFCTYLVPGRGENGQGNSMPGPVLLAQKITGSRPVEKVDLGFGTLRKDVQACVTTLAMVPGLETLKA